MSAPKNADFVYKLVAAHPFAKAAVYLIAVHCCLPLVLLWGLYTHGGGALIGWVLVTLPTSILAVAIMDTGKWSHWLALLALPWFNVVLYLLVVAIYSRWYPRSEVQSAREV